MKLSFKKYITKTITNETYKRAQKNVFLKGYGQASAFLDPSILKDYTAIGLKHLQDGANHISDWRDKMVEELGEKAEPHLLGIWNGLKKESPELFECENKTFSSNKNNITKNLEQTQLFSEINNIFIKNGSSTIYFPKKRSMYLFVFLAGIICLHIAFLSSKSYTSVSGQFSIYNATEEQYHNYLNTIDNGWLQEKLAFISHTRTTHLFILPEEFTILFYIGYFFFIGVFVLSAKISIKDIENGKK